MEESLSDVIIDKWLTILIDIQELPMTTVPRAYVPSSNQSSDIRSMYVFSDASTKSYGVVVYICKNNHISLVISKSCIAFIKNITLPKLKLTATVVATRLPCSSLCHIFHGFSMTCICITLRQTLWMDSMITTTPLVGIEVQMATMAINRCSTPTS